MSSSSLPARTVVITGGNSGLGYRCAQTIAASGQNWHVVIASRDRAKTASAVEQLKRETGYRGIDAFHLDLASLSSTRAFAQELAASNLPPLHAIVCNAGLTPGQNVTYTQDGFEAAFGVNHLGHFLLVNLLLHSLATPARILFITSGTHDPATFDGRISPPQYENARKLAWPEKDGGHAMSGVRRYTTSKLCNLFCTYELDRRLRAEGFNTEEHPITVNAYDPGATPGTGLIREQPRLFQRYWTSGANRWLLSLIGGETSTVEVSGDMMARLILDPAFEHTTGKYFHILHETASSKESYDLVEAKELWESSVELVKLTPDETILRLPSHVS